MTSIPHPETASVASPAPDYFTAALGAADPEIAAAIAGELARHQQQQLSALVTHAMARSPFYRDHYAGRIGAELRLQDLPVTNKALLMDNFDRVVTDPRLTADGVQRHLQALRGDELYLISGATVC